MISKVRGTQMALPCIFLLSDGFKGEQGPLGYDKLGQFNRFTRLSQKP